jgi:hypothetical protein
MTEPTDPLWHHLPHAPRRFFKLHADASREELKQAYSVLIRAFKPDKFPEEFKRIRAAYEQIDREMRYGMTDDSPIAPSISGDGTSEQNDASTLPFAFDVHSYAEPPHRMEQTTAPELATPSGEMSSRSMANGSQLSQRAAAYQHVESADPEAWYAELANQSLKTPYEYYVLAILSDVVASPTQSFGAWIADGAAKHPTNSDLSGLLKGLLANPQLPPDEACELLLRLAKSTPPSAYYYLTESLWQRRVLTDPWETFETTLAACERALAGNHGAPRVAFSIAIMRRAMWRAPLEWLQARKRWIEESRIALHSQLEFDHELNCKLLGLREQHTTRLQQGQFGRRILESIHAFCEEGEWESATQICACQMEIATHPKEFLIEFDYRPEDSADWSHGWQWISWLALSKLPTQEKPGENQWMVQTIAETMRGIDRRFPRSIERNVGLLNLLATFAYFASFLVGLIFLIGLTTIAILTVSGVKNESYLFGTMGVLVGGVTLCIWLWLRLKKRWHAKITQPYIRKRVIRDYQSHWRLPLARSMQILLCPYHYYYGIVQHLAADERNVVGPSKWMVPLMPHDLGLMLYSAAVPFAR